MEREERNEAKQQNLEKNSNKDKKTEKGRYQPPSCRSNVSSNSKDCSSISTELKNFEHNNLNIQKFSLKSLNEDNSASDSVIGNNESRGLLKINTTLNDLIAKNEKFTINEKIENRKDFKQTDFEEYKMLYDPNNPNKPIYVKSNKNANKSLSINENLESRDSKMLNVQKNDPLSILESKDRLKASQMNDLIKSIKQNEQRLKNMYDKFDSNKSIISFCNEINPLRKKLEDLCINALLTHLESFISSNLDLNNWKMCYHKLIELLRSELNNTNLNNKNIDTINEIHQLLKEYLDEGFRFYNNLIDLLETKIIKFKIHLLFDLNNYEYLINNADQFQKSIDTTIKTNDMKYALIVIHRSLISLGDLARYKEMIFCASSSFNDQRNQPDYSTSRAYYLKAMIIQPKSSRSYHQLAIIAIYTKRHLDACYYYFRCLELSNPLITVKQSLNSIFEEARTKSDSIVKMLISSISSKKNKLSKRDNNINARNFNKNRVEIWIKASLFQKNNLRNEKLSSNKNTSSSSENEDEENYSDYESSLDLINDESKLDFKYFNEKKMSIDELNKNFMLNYLNTIGKLFTKVGMETYDDLFLLMLHEFKELLKREPCSLGKIRLLQITTINISLIDLNYKSIINDNKESKSINLQLEYSIELGIDMLIIVVKRFNHYLSKSFNESEKRWQLFLPSIKIFVEWMISNIKIWYGFRNKKDNKLNQNRWQVMCDMFNLIKKYNEKNHNHESDNLKNVTDYLNKLKLEEDIELAGFLPLISLSKKDYDYQLNSDDLSLILKNLDEDKINAAKNKKRMKKLCLFADFLCSLEEPIFKFDVLNNCYNNNSTCNSNKVDFDKPMTRNNQRSISNSTNSSIRSNSKIDDNEELFDENNSIEKNSREDDNDNLNNLKEKRNKLKAKMNEKSKIDKSHKTLLEMSVKRRIELEIRPKFIIPDTNCFVDFLNLIDKILSTSHYIIVVPLLVINELEKLSKTIPNYNDDSFEHAEYVQESAKKSIKYLNEKFDKREKNLKAITSQGSVLETIQFRSEEVKKQGTNDELILGCCLHYCKENPRDLLPNDKSDLIHLFRDVVLLTDDRHLRLKAHTKNVPVKNIKQFVKWSNL